MLDASVEDIADYARLAAPAKAQATHAIGRVGQLVVDSIDESVGVLRPLARELFDAVVGNLAPSALPAMLAGVVAKHANDDALAELLFAPAIKSEIAGQMMVRREAGTLVSRETRASAPGWADMKQPAGSILGLPWPEAVAEFLRRGIVQERDFAPILRQHIADSEEARALILRRLRDRTEELVVQALEDDKPFDNFVGDFNGFTDKLGVSRGHPAYVENVFRTNIQSAYGAARLRAMDDPDVRAARPYVEAMVVGDARTSEICRPLTGLVFEAANPAWRPAMGPNHYQCRTTWVTASAADVRGRKISDALPPGWAALPGF